MTNVIDINTNKPHVSGPAKCLNCGHKWHAIVLKGGYEGGFECEECGHLKGEFIGTFIPKDERFECGCGCDLFFLLPEGKSMCPNCGNERGMPIYD